MEFQEFKAIANGSSVFFLIALTLLLENGSSAVSESEEAELKSVLAKGLHNFFSDEALGEVVCLAKSLSGIAPSELVDYIQQCDPILKQELHDLDEQFTSLRYLSDELQIRARGLRAQKRAA